MASGGKKRDPRSLARGRPSRHPKKRFILVTEGRETEPSYFSFLNRIRLAHVRVECVDSHGVPSTLVDLAVEEKRALRGAAGEDEVWVVADRDVHPGLPDCLQKARANRVHVALSCPCFELWLLIHFDHQAAHLERNEAQRRTRCHLHGFDKTLTETHFRRLAGGFGEARKRAAELVSASEWDENPLRNPCTTVHRLVDAILRAMQRFEGDSVQPSGTGIETAIRTMMAATTE